MLFILVFHKNWHKVGVALDVASRNENLCSFYKRYECFETFQEVVSGFAIYGECITTTVKHKGPTVTFFSKHKSAESSNISHTALSIYNVEVYRYIRSAKYRLPIWQIFQYRQSVFFEIVLIFLLIFYTNTNWLILLMHCLVVSIFYCVDNHFTLLLFCCC